MANNNNNISKAEVLSVRVDDAMKSVKALKTEINKLRDSTLSLTKGSDEYNRTVDELQSKQRLLNETMALTRRDAVALEGSYDSLTYRMSVLKKEWKATNDEAKRNDLGKEIAEINQQLKNLDASTGNFQRNVGDYDNQLSDSFKSLKQEIKNARAELLNAEEGTTEYTTAMEKLSEAQFKLRDMNEKSRYAVADLGEQLTNVVGITSGLMSGFQAVQGAMVLFGADTEDFEKTLIKLQSTLAIVNGLQGLEGMKDRIEGLTTVLSNATKLSKGWLGVIALLTTAIVAVVGVIGKKRKALDELNITQSEYNDLVVENQKSEISGIAKQIAMNDTLSKIVKDGNYSYNDRVKASKLLLQNLEFEINDTNVLVALEGKFDEAVRKSNDRLLEKSRAMAVLQTTTNLYNQLMEKQIALDSLQRAKENLEDNVKFSDKLKQSLSMLVGVYRDLDEYTGERIDKEIQALTEQITALETTIQNFSADNFTEVINGLLGDNEKKSVSTLADEELAKLDKVYKRKIEYSQLTENNERNTYNITVEWYNKRAEIIDKYIGKANEIPSEEQSRFALEELLMDDNLNKSKLFYEEKKRLLEEDKTNRNEYITNVESSYKDEINIISKYRENYKKLNGDIFTVNIESINNEINVINGKLLELYNLRTEWSSKGIEITKEHNDLILQLEQDKTDKQIEIEVLKNNEIDRLRKEHRTEEAEQLSNLEYVIDYNIRVNTLKNSDRGDESVYKTQYNLMLKGMEERKKLLKDFWEQAKNDNDGEAMLDYQRGLAEIELQIDEAKYKEKLRLQEKYVKGVQSTLGLAGQYLNAYYQIKEANARKDEKISEEEAEKLKQIQIAEVWVQTLAGMVSAYASAQKLGFPKGLIVGTAQAGAVLAMGLANKKQIEAQNMTGETTKTNDFANMPSTPNIQSNFTSQPFQYNRTLTGYKEVEELNNARRVYVVESDITEAQNATKVKVTESTW